MRLLPTLLFVSVSQLALAQATELQSFNQQRQHITQTGMITISTWGATNLIVNGLALRNASGSDKAFYQMNIAWGAVDLLLGSIGLIGNRRAALPTTAFATLEEQQKIEKVFLVNAGLDVAYVTGGFYLRERAKARAENSERNEGYGKSLLLQGGFLLLFDGAMYAVHRVHFKKNKAFWQRLDVAEQGIGVRVKF